MLAQAFERSRTLEDPARERALAVIQGARIPLRIAIALAMAVAVLVPALLGLPRLSAVGVLFSVVLVVCLRAIETDPETFRRAGHVSCLLALAIVSYAILGFDLPAEISVYLMAATLLAAAQFLGIRAALFWGVSSLALIAAASFFPPDVEREVPPAISFVVRAGALTTILSFAVLFRSSHEEQSAELEIRATTDPLTGLANRREFDRRLGDALLRSKRFDRQGALVFVDLDGMKQVNDSFGHSAGDELIRTTAARIAGVTRNVDTPARLGGDEFVILLSEYGEPTGGEIFARRLLAALSAPIDLRGELLKPSASIGIALFPAVGLNAADVLSAADGAMYEAKRAGGGRVFVRDGSDLREVA